MIKSKVFITALSLVFTSQVYAQIGQADPQTTYPTHDSLVLVSMDYLAELIRGQYHDEMIEATTIIDLEEALREIEDAKLRDAGLKIFPDFTQDYLQLQLLYDQDYDVALYDAHHEKVLELTGAFGSNQLNLHDLPSGTYKVELISRDETYVKRIVKE